MRHAPSLLATIVVFYRNIEGVGVAHDIKCEALLIYKKHNSLKPSYLLNGSFIPLV